MGAISNRLSDIVPSDEASDRFVGMEGGLGLKDGQLKIITFNMQDHNMFMARSGNIAKLMQFSGADFVGSQECEHQRCADRLVQANPRYKYVRYPPIFYDSEKWTVDETENGAFMLSDTPNVQGSNTWGFRWPRAAGWARFVPKNNASGTGVYVYNTHFCCCGCSQKSQLKSAVLIQKHMVENREYPNDPVFLTGDFNAAENMDAIRWLKGELPSPANELCFVDTFRELHPEKNGNTGHVFKIDYIFGPCNAEVVAARIASVTPAGSDHYPVSAVVRV